jgi:hypothetical protein
MDNNSCMCMDYIHGKDLDIATKIISHITIINNALMGLKKKRCTTSKTQ